MGLELINLSVGPRDTALFAPLTLTIPGGEIASVMGPSGVGKSTLLDAIGGHLAPEFEMRGTVRLNGREVQHLPAERRRIGLLFQEALLFPHLSVGQNLTFGLPPGLRGTARDRAVGLALEQAGLAGFAHRDPATLSGGQRARAALMQAILARPEALLLDEPFSRLDAALRAGIRDFTFEHIRAAGIPALLVTHDEADARAAGGAILRL